MAKSSENWPEPYREILQEFAQQLMRSVFLGKIDVSGVVQKTLAEAAEQPPPNENSTAQIAWLKAVLRNNFQSEVRKLTTQKRDVQREKPLADVDLPSKDPSPSRMMTKAEELRRMFKHLAELPPEQQDAIRMRYIEGMKLEIIAIRMNQSRAAAAGVLRRGLATLREFLKSDSDSKTPKI